MLTELTKKYRLIREAVAEKGSSDPVEVVQSVMRQEFISMHGPEHHFLDGAAFLVAYKNSGGQIDLESCFNELEKRAASMPGAMCGYWGICGSVASVGAAMSIIRETGPLSTDRYYKEHMEYASRVLETMSRIGGARCCKRNAFLALSIAAKFMRERYGMPMESGKINCNFSSRNAQCLGIRCPFYSQSAE